MIYRMETSAVIYFSVAAESEEAAIKKAGTVIERYSAGLSIGIGADGTELDMRAYFQDDSGAPPDVVNEWGELTIPAIEKGGAA